MVKIITSFVLVVCVASSTVFAQRGSGQQPRQAALTTASQSIGQDGFIRLPTRNDSVAVAARHAFNAAQRIIAPPTSTNPFRLTQPNLQERQAQWQQALDTINTLLVFIEPPSEEPQEKPKEELPKEPPDTKPNEQQDTVSEQQGAEINKLQDIEVSEVLDTVGEQQDTTSKQAEAEQPKTQPDFVPDALVKAHYLLGKGLIYQDMVMSGLLNRATTNDLARKAVENFEAFVQIGIGNTAVVFPMLSSLYSNPLNNPFRALRWINRGIAAEPRNAFFHIKRSQLLRDLGRPTEACESLRQARTLGEATATTLMQMHGCR